MPDIPRRVVLITGASFGIGRACAQHLHNRGFKVYGTSRRPPEEFDADFTMLQMDVTDDESVRRGVDLVLEREGRVDVLVNNAAMLLAGAIEDTTVDEARREVETIFFGAMRTCRAVLPAMRKQKRGLIVNMSSMAGRVGIPFQGLYSSCKFAIEGFSEALRMEVRPFGIDVVLMEPGDVWTGQVDRREWAAATRQGSPYTERARRTLDIMQADEAKGSKPELVARALEKIVTAPKPAMRYAPGPAWQWWAMTLKHLVPYWFFEWGISKYYKTR